MTTDRLCKGCNKPPPAEWCWDNKPYDCWLGLPPRNLTTRAVWELVRELDGRMIGVQPGMNVGKQARKFDTRIAHAGTEGEAVYLAYLKGLMLATVAMGAPQPASNFLPMYDEEFEGRTDELSR